VIRGGDDNDDDDDDDLEFFTKKFEELFNTFNEKVNEIDVIKNENFIALKDLFSETTEYLLNIMKKDNITTDEKLQIKANFKEIQKFLYNNQKIQLNKYLNEKEIEIKNGIKIIEKYDQINNDGPNTKYSYRPNYFLRSKTIHPVFDHNHFKFTTSLGFEFKDEKEVVGVYLNEEQIMQIKKIESNSDFEGTNLIDGKIHSLNNDNDEERKIIIDSIKPLLEGNGIFRSIEQVINVINKMIDINNEGEEQKYFYRKKYYKPFFENGVFIPYKYSNFNGYCFNFKILSPGDMSETGSIEKIDFFSFIEAEKI
jgi:hypothetical protein